MVRIDDKHFLWNTRIHGTRGRFRFDMKVG